MIRLVRENATGRVLRWFGSNEQFVLQDKTVECNSFTVTSDVDISVVEAEAFPPKYIDGVFALTGGVWSVYDQAALDKIDAEIAIIEAKGKLDRFLEEFKQESDATVLSNGEEWNGGLNSSFTIKGQADLKKQRGVLKGTVYTKANRPTDFTTNELLDIAADIGDAYEKAYTKLQSRSIAIELCMGDLQCIRSIL